jgi:hypothetical protein
MDPRSSRAPADGKSNPLRTIDRREFLELAGLSSAALLVGPDGAQAATNSTGKLEALAQHAAFHSLAPGKVIPEGWLKLYLQKQAQRLAGHLPEVSLPFTGAYWAGEERPPQELEWTPWEQRAYWIDGALRCCLALQDEKLVHGAFTAVRYTVNHPFPDGYLGPAFARDAKDEETPAYDNFRWPHNVFFRALAAYGEATNDPGIASAIRRHYLADKGRVDYGGPSRNVTNIEGMLWAYERTGEEQLLELAEKSWNDFIRSAPPGDRESGDLHPDRVFANTPIHAHGVTYIEKAKLPAILYMHTGKAAYLRFALAAHERIFNHHMLIDGIPSTSEMYGQTTAVDAHEACDIVDHTWSWGYLLMATGDGVWADRIERASFNAGMGTIKKDWDAIQYFSCPNQVIATQTSNRVLLVPEDTPWMAFAPNPGHRSACCAGNMHRLFPNYVIRMWMRNAKDGGLAAMLYGASTVRAEVGVNRQLVEIHQETDYPFGEEIHFTIGAAKAVRFALSLRIPGWCTAPRLVLNERPLSLPAVNKGFLRIDREFQPGDRITLALPMRAALTFWPGNGVGIEHGPLVYALRVKEHWSPVVTPKWSTVEYPEWDATAASPWNYGLAAKEMNILARSVFERKAMTEDPWVDPPVTLTVPLKKIPGWELASRKYPDRKLTPSLPQIDDEQARSLESVATGGVTLVPYGATHLRVAIFPETQVE